MKQKGFIRNEQWKSFLQRKHQILQCGFHGIV